MIHRAVLYTPEAEDDLISMYDHFAAAASSNVALGFLRRVRTWLDGFSAASERGTRRDDIRPGLRTIGFRRRLTVAFTVTSDTVVILRVLYGGQEWEAALKEE